MRSFIKKTTIYSLCMIGMFVLFPNVGFGENSGIAQKDSSLRREMLLEAEYTPNIRDANKINALPPVTDPPPVKAVINYSSRATITSPPDEAARFRAEHLGTKPMLYDKRGYVTAGGGNYLNLKVAAGYEIINSESDYLRLSANHFSTNGKVKYLQDNSSEKAKLNDNLLNAFYKHRFEYFDLNASANYGYTGFNYYGYNKFNDPSGVIPDKMQVFQLINPTVGIKSTHDGNINYEGNISYSHFSKKYGMLIYNNSVSEDDIFTRLNLSGDFNGTLIGVNSYMHNLFYRNTNYNDYMVFCINPYLENSNEKRKLHAGVKTAFASEGKRKLSIAPDVEAEYDVSKGTWLYLHVGGGKEVYTLSNIAKENRYLNPEIKPEDADSPLDARLGIRSSELEKWFFNAYLRYKITDNMHYYYRSDTYALYGRFPNAFEYALYDKSRLMQLGGQVAFNHRDQIAVSLKLVKNGWNTEIKLPDGGKISKPILVPDFEIDASVDVTVLPELKVNLGYELQSGRYGLIETEVMKIKNIENVTLGANYAFNRSFSVYLQINNLLNRKYEYWHTCPEQGIGLIGGCTFMF